MPLTTIKRCQSEPNWWYTVEDCNVEVTDEAKTGLTIKAHDELSKEGRTLIAINKEDALLIRDAINQLYPPITELSPTSNTSQPQTFSELLAAFVVSAQGTLLAQDRDSNFPSENSITSSTGEASHD